MIIGAVGAVLPILPTTPFLILAAACFTKGSKKFHTWFVNTKIYKNHIDSLVREKKMTLKSKVLVLSSITIVFAFGIFFMKAWPLRLMMITVLLCHYVYFIGRIKTVPEEKKLGEVEND